MEVQWRGSRKTNKSSLSWSNISKVPIWSNSGNKPKQSNTQAKSLEKNETANIDITMIPTNGETNGENKIITPTRAFTEPTTWVKKRN